MCCTRWRKSIDEYIHREGEKEEMNEYLWWSKHHFESHWSSFFFQLITFEKSRQKKAHKFVAFKSISVGWFHAKPMINPRLLLIFIAMLARKYFSSLYLRRVNTFLYCLACMSATKYEVIFVKSCEWFIDGMEFLLSSGVFEFILLPFRSQKTH